ncbi:hypothetical protein EVAR_97039_1 [Eumeta japonica]|uniref:Uncharacterized protein n=1 Tax=Eumeta variegata TaxID=151549 RepID=A0A4C1WMP6_EUMVA|nr:hypothetical protein EVAR_97039_1 [Eumeta japonica]
MVLSLANTCLAHAYSLLPLPWSQQRGLSQPPPSRPLTQSINSHLLSWGKEHSGGIGNVRSQSALSCLLVWSYRDDGSFILNHEVVPVLQSAVTPSRGQ